MPGMHVSVYVCALIHTYMHVRICTYVHIHPCTYTYRLRGLFGGDFNLAVWRFFTCPPNLNKANIVLELSICIAATTFCQIKVMPTTITNRFT